jgi:hypothetical protein
MQFNISDDELPEGVESTDEIMAQNGVWVPGSEATRMLDELISHISSQKIKFGLFKDDVEEVLDELNKSLEVAKKARSANGMFNFAIVM